MFRGGDINPVQKAALSLLLEIELRERMETGRMGMRANRVLAQMAGVDFDESFVGTGVQLPPGEAPQIARTDSEIDDALGRDGEPNGPAQYLGGSESISEADFDAMLADLQTQKFSAADVIGDELWGRPV